MSSGRWLVAVWLFLAGWLGATSVVVSTAIAAAPSPRDAERCAESWLPFVERVGMPWVALLVCLAIMGAGVFLFITRLSPELAKIAANWAISNERWLAAKESTNQLAAEVRHPTPVHGTPIPVIVDKVKP